MSGNGSGASAHSIDLPSNPLSGTADASSAAVIKWMAPSESPKAMYAPVGDTATEVMYEGVSS